MGLPTEDLEFLLAERCTDPGQKFWSQTYSGVAFSLLHPEPEMVKIEDIAHHLSLINRFNGATKFPYSVAEHSLSVSYYLSSNDCASLSAFEAQKLMLQGLLHDAAEAYTGDIVRPFKRILPEFFEIVEERINIAIGLRFNVTLDSLPASVHHADAVMLMTEKRDLLRPSPRKWTDANAKSTPQPLKQPILHPSNYTSIRQAFLDRFHSLYPLKDKL